MSLYELCVALVSLLALHLLDTPLRAILVPLPPPQKRWLWYV